MTPMSRAQAPSSSGRRRNGTPLNETGRIESTPLNVTLSPRARASCRAKNSRSPASGSAGQSRLGSNRIRWWGNST